MSGSLRWVTWGDGSEWHLRFGSYGQVLCERSPHTTARNRLLAEGPPAKRCPACAEVIRMRLGLPDVAR